MVDGLVSFVQSVLIKRRKLAEFSFQLSVTILGQLFLQSDKDDLENAGYLLRSELPTVTSGGMQ